MVGLSFSSNDSFALSSGVKSGLMDSDDVSFDLFCNKVLTSADRRNLTSKGLGRELLLSCLPRWKKSLMAEESILLSISEKNVSKHSRSLFKCVCLLVLGGCSVIP